MSDVDHERAKRSAASVALLRLVGSYDDPPARNPDRLAGAFCGRAARTLVALAPVRRAARAWIRRGFPGAIEYQTARTRHLDRLLQEQLVEGATQLVLLGAGYDTRPYRFGERLAGVRVFEVDHPATLARRVELAARAFPSARPSTRVAIDFDREQLAGALAGAGHDRTRRTLFLWEGVTMFITAAAVDRVLTSVASCVPGSTIAFDYVDRSALERPQDHYGGAEAARHFARTGEAWSFGLDPGRIGEFLVQRGLRLRSHSGPEQLQDAYLRARDGTLAGRVPTFHGIVHAEVSAP